MKRANFFRNFRPRFIRGANRGGSAKLTTKMDAKIKKRNEAVAARRFVTIGVIISTVMVGVSIFVAVYFEPQTVAERKFEELARTYYEDYYHEKLMNSIEPDLFEEKMKLFETTGLQPVLLRQLLLYQNGKYSSYKKYFESGKFSCDKNKMSAKFYPVAPYGKKDYTLKMEIVCNNE